MKNNRSMKRRGFTLVELLIVIVVIGVLSAMMMLSSTEAVSSAKASNIISNLRNLKTAALSWYADHLDDVDDLGTEVAALNGNRTDILKYLNNDSNTGDLANYKFLGTKEDKSWFVYYDGDVSGNVDTKLAGRAESVGLLSAASATKPTSTLTSGTGSAKYTGESNTKPYMFIR